MPFTKDNIDDLETAPSPGDRLNTFKEEVCLQVRDDSLQVFFFEIYLLDYDKNPDEKSKALNTISKISGNFFCYSIGVLPIFLLKFLTTNN